MHFSCGFINDTSEGMTGIVLAGGDRNGKTYFYNMSNDAWMELGKLARPRSGAEKLLFLQAYSHAIFILIFVPLSNKSKINT